MEAAAKDKALVNLATGLEDAERVLVAFLVATAALSQGKQVVIWATKEAVRLGLPGGAQGVACKGCPPLERLFEQFADGGGELWLCPICLDARDLGDAEKVSQRPDRRRDPSVGVGRQRYDRVQLLTPLASAPIAVASRRPASVSTPSRSAGPPNRAPSTSRSWSGVPVTRFATLAVTVRPADGNPISSRGPVLIGRITPSG